MDVPHKRFLFPSGNTSGSGFFCRHVHCNSIDTHRISRHTSGREVAFNKDCPAESNHIDSCVDLCPWSASLCARVFRHTDIYDYIQPIISDSIVIWRAFVLLKMQRKRQLIILPLLILLGSIGMLMSSTLSILLISDCTQSYDLCECSTCNNGRQHYQCWFGRHDLRRGPSFISRNKCRSHRPHWLYILVRFK